MRASPRIAELNTVQLPLVRHAEAVGWECVSKDTSIAKRRGVEGLFHYDELDAALIRLNPGVITSENVQSIIQELEAIPPTMQGNRDMLDWLRGARTIAVPEEKRRRNICLVDFDDVDRNVFQVTYEWEYTPKGRKGNRADVVFLINGIPVAVIENKNPKLADAMDRAVKQFRRYELETPEMLLAPQVFNVTHLIKYLYGVTWNYSRKNIFEWKEQRSETFQQAVQSFFRKPTLLRMLRDWILFYVKDDELQKTILRQHQTRAAVKVVERCADSRKHRGLIWHTQGSGKTFTLITAARLMLEDHTRFAGATVLLVVDRNELEGQLSGWVERLVGEMRGAGIVIASAASKAKLQELLDQDFRGLIISMIHKFDGIRTNSCTRENFYVLIDEAHRSTGGDLGNYLMGALPNATLIGFTGTPIDKTAQGQGTFKTFGVEDQPAGYLDKYSMSESIEDGTTLKLRHTLAPTAIALPDEMLDQEFLSLAETEGVSDIDELNRILDRAVRLKTFLKADDRVDQVARFVAQHFKESVAPLGYKAFLVAVDREACAKYKAALDRYLPAEMAAAVYTKNSLDALDRPLVARYQLDEAQEKDVRENFKKPGMEPQILIVTDKLLTGYDAPILYCMYLDKPMRDHVLLQAVARINRPYEDEDGRKKPCGLIIDFVGVLKELNRAFSFDSAEVESVIEDLDLLLARFRELMGESATRFLDAGEGTPDQQLERQLYERFFDPEKRREFFEYFQEVETLYEILSPDAALREYLPTYQRLADLYAALRSEYGSRGAAIGSDLGHKTEQLLQQRTTSGEVLEGKAVEYDAKTLDSLRKNASTDNGKIMNLLRDLRNRTELEADANPALRGLFERAQAVTAQFQDRQLTTVQALEEITRLQGERARAEEERTKLGLDPDTFGIYWLLQQEQVASARELAVEISGVFARFPNFRRSADELRQLKAEIYKVLLKQVAGRKMVDLADRMIATRSR